MGKSYRGHRQLEWWLRPGISSSDLSGGGGHPVTSCVEGIGCVEPNRETVIADAGSVATEGETPILSDSDLLIQRLLGAVRPVQPVVQERSRLTDIEILLQSMLPVGDGFRLPCFDSNDLDDDVLSVGPMRPLLTAASLGGAGRADDCQLQVDSLNDELSVETWPAENRHETCCAQLDNFDWVVPPYNLDMILPRPELDEESSEQDVCDVPDEFPVGVDKAAVESLCLPEVVLMRPQVGCDPDLPLPVDTGKVSLVEDGPDVIVSGRKSNMGRSDVSREICVVLDQCPVVVPKLAAVPLVLPVVVQTRPQVGCGPDLPLPVEEGKVSLVVDGLDVIFSGRKSNVQGSDVSSDICVVPDLFPVLMPKKAAEPLVLPVGAVTRSQAGGAPALTLPVNDDINSQVGVVPDMLSGRVMESISQVLLEVVPFMDRDGCLTGWLETEIDQRMMEKFVLVPEMSPIGSMTSAVVPTFLPSLSEVCSLAVLAGGSLLRQTLWQW